MCERHEIDSSLQLFRLIPHQVFFYSNVQNFPSSNLVQKNFILIVKSLLNSRCKYLITLGLKTMDWLYTIGYTALFVVPFQSPSVWGEFQPIAESIFQQKKIEDN
jgi:hypothetical protein